MKRSSYSPPPTASQRMRLDSPAAPLTFSEAELFRRSRGSNVCIVPDQDCSDYGVALNSAQQKIEEVVRRKLANLKSIKFYMRVESVYHDKEDTEKVKLGSETMKAVLLLDDTNLPQKITEMLCDANKRIDEYIERDSGWIFKNLKVIELGIERYRPFRGGSYIESPDWLRRKRAVINVVNKSDEKCFVWSVLAHIFPQQKNPNRLEHYERLESRLNTTMLAFPVTLDQIESFEEQNELAVNVYAYDDNRQLRPIRLTDKRRVNAIIQLLLLEEGEKHHFCLIKEIGRLLHTHTRSGHRHWACPFCCAIFDSESSFDKHYADCSIGIDRVEMPTNGVKKFTNIKNQLATSLVIYADFECF
ncbi:MAG TPA: hypothetical protein VFM18_06720, partial [Methanosarcina sp.]|nr:hypothetical protein [Methanosarcina sp.]